MAYDKTAIIISKRGKQEFVNKYPARVITKKGKMALEILLSKRLLGLKRNVKYLPLPDGDSEMLAGKDFFVYISPAEEAYYPAKTELTFSEADGWKAQFKPIPTNLRFLYINNIKKIFEKSAAHESLMIKYFPLISYVVIGIVALIIFKVAFDGAAALLAQGNAQCAVNVKEALMTALGGG